LDNSSKIPTALPKHQTGGYLDRVSLWAIYGAYFGHFWLYIGTF